MFVHVLERHTKIIITKCVHKAASVVSRIKVPSPFHLHTDGAPVRSLGPVMSLVAVTESMSMQGGFYILVELLMSFQRGLELTALPVVMTAIDYDLSLL